MVEMAQLRVKHSFSKQHFRTARYFATRCQQLEQGVDNAVYEESVRSIHRSYVTGAIISAVAGLEASVNELYLEACDNNRKALQGLSDVAIAEIAKSWEEIERKRRSILFKFGRALLLSGAERFDKDKQPYQDAASLVKLRHALVHYKPEWDSELEVHEDLQNRLRSRFRLNPLVAEDSLWFPHLCLGSGCAMWAVDASERFLTDFCDRMGIPNRL